MTIKNAFRRGFTLIELMIVIVILGILMGTILPRLTGAQSRARDTARIADLNNISQALEVYSSDFGQYPDAKCTATDCGGGKVAIENCLDIAGDVAGDTYFLLKTYLKGDRVPQNVGKLTTSKGCIGSYYYQPLTKGGTANASYLLLSDLETWQMANFDLSDQNVIDAFAASPNKDSDFIPKMNKLVKAPIADTDSVYVVIP